MRNTPLLKWYDTDQIIFEDNIIGIITLDKKGYVCIYSPFGDLTIKIHLPGMLALLVWAKCRTSGVLDPGTLKNVSLSPASNPAIAGIPPRPVCLFPYDVIEEENWWVD